MMQPIERQQRIPKSIPKMIPIITPAAILRSLGGGWGRDPGTVAGRNTQSHLSSPSFHLNP